jgi:hypothetical protein
MEDLKNTYNPPATDAEEQKQKEAEQPRKSSLLKSILDGTVFQRRKVVRQLPFLVMLTVMGVLYIFNSNYTDRTIIEMNRTKRKLQELRFNYVTTKANVMYLSRQSTLNKSLQIRGIRESIIPPYKIIIKE